MNTCFEWDWICFLFTPSQVHTLNCPKNTTHYTSAHLLTHTIAAPGRNTIRLILFRSIKHPDLGTHLDNQLFMLRSRPIFFLSTLGLVQTDHNVGWRPLERCQESYNWFSWINHQIKIHKWRHTNWENYWTPLPLCHTKTAFLFTPLYLMPQKFQHPSPYFRDLRAQN